MEKKLTSFKGVKVGQLFLIDNPFMGEDLVVCASIENSHKYPISKQDDGRKFRMIDDETTGRTKPQYADEVGDEMIKEYSLLSSKTGDYMFKEDDSPLVWNIRRIDKKHPKYDESFSKEELCLIKCFKVLLI